MEVIKRRKKNLLHPLNIVSILLFPLCLIVLPVAIYRLYSFRAEIIKTKKKIRVRRGILIQSVSEVNFEDIRNITTRQSVFQSWIGVGDLGFGTAATAVQEIEMKGIPYPEWTKRKIEGIMSGKGEPGVPPGVPEKFPSKKL